MAAVGAARWKTLDLGHRILGYMVQRVHDSMTCGTELNMTVPPIVRDLVLCEDFVRDPENSSRISLVNLVYSIRPTDPPEYPATQQALCAFAALTNGHGSGTMELRIVQVDSGDEIRHWELGVIGFGDDPLRVFGLPIRLQTCVFPAPGWYWVQLDFDGHTIAQKDLLLR